MIQTGNRNLVQMTAKRMIIRFRREEQKPHLYTTFPRALPLFKMNRTGSVSVDNSTDGKEFLRIINFNKMVNQSVSIPSGVCYANSGCGVLTTTMNETFISRPFTKSLVYTPGFSITIINDTCMGIICEYDGSNGNCSDHRTTLFQEKIKIDPANPPKVGFTLFPSNATSGVGYLPGAEFCITRLFNPSARTLEVTSNCISGPEPPALISLSGGIAKYIDATHEEIRYVFNPKECAETNSCGQSGTWTANAADTYFGYSNAVITLAPGSIPPQLFIQSKSWNMDVA